MESSDETTSKSIDEAKDTEKAVINNETADTDFKVPIDIAPKNEKETKREKPKVQEAFSYSEPPWSGISPDKYGFEVLKSGVIIDNISLDNKSYFLFGRLPACDIYMQHPTISRNHAILQYRAEPSENEKRGYYLMDLDSTHGTFINKRRLKSSIYVPLHVGDLVKFGNSTRLYILTGPPAEENADDAETELVLDKINDDEDDLEERKTKTKKQETREEDAGIDWGMGEDAADSDHEDNPFAVTNNEHLYSDDPKKALKNLMEREGFEYSYDVTEKGFSQFLCTVKLPVVDARGASLTAEVLWKGKKKEAVAQCALEACRILDRYGFFSQKNKEAAKRKVKRWEDCDFYDSDEDAYLDRTGTIEKKRQRRIVAANNTNQLAESHESLLSEKDFIESKIIEVQKKLDEALSVKSKCAADEEEEDALDSYMKDLQQNDTDKSVISKLKVELSGLKKQRLKIDVLLKNSKSILPQKSS